ncbi:MAG TPA: hypothetical protein PLR25_01055 [Planctomycetaceae bacterium]|nr:hypothetical protein [Planctomycetaceae bacterium]
MPLHLHSEFSGDLRMLRVVDKISQFVWIVGQMKQLLTRFRDEPDSGCGKCFADVGSQPNAAFGKLPTIVRLKNPVPVARLRSTNSPFSMSIPRYTSQTSSDQPVSQSPEKRLGTDAQLLQSRAAATGDR